MTRKNQLKFSGDGTSVKIVFSNRSESMEYDSQTKAVIALLNLSKESKIDDKEFKAMTTQVLEAENLPKGAPLTKEVRKDLLEKALSMLASDLGNVMGVIDVTITSPIPRFNQAYASTEKAHFEMCPSGLPHGHIYVKMGMIDGMIPSKNFGFLTVKFLRDANLIDDDEEKKLEFEINNSTLPKIDPMQAQA